MIIPTKRRRIRWHLLLVGAVLLITSPRPSLAASCDTQRILTYDDRVAKAAFSFDPTACPAPERFGTMHVLLQVQRGDAVPVRKEFFCAPLEVCEGEVEIEHLSVDWAEYDFYVGHESDGEVNAWGQRHGHGRCMSAVVRYGCPIQLIP